MTAYVLGFAKIDQTDVPLAGGKGAQLGVLSRLSGVHVPPGFCITTAAYDRILATIDLSAPGAEIRRQIEAVALPEELAAEIREALGDGRYAVRSSATAEDLPSASFAGQHDSYLNVAATDVIAHVRRCWASLFTERAVIYRARNGFDHGKVRMAVVVQEMVPADAAGVLFTADPISGHRKITTIEASFGLGEALVSGHVIPDSFRVRGEQVIEKQLATAQPTLTDVQAVRLAQLGRRIEAHLGSPQDIEWCLAGDTFHIVQSRPITTLFPIPANDGANHVYISVGHQQMMTDAIKPLGLSMFQLTALRPMDDAGGRLFVDVTQILGSAASRTAMLNMVGKSDPLIGDALQTVLDRGGFIPVIDGDVPFLPPGAPLETDPAIVHALIARMETSLAAAERAIAAKSGAAVFDFILEDLQELKRLLFDRQSHQLIMASVEATWWLNDHLHAWLGETNAALTLAQSVPHNVTSEMGLALLHVADVIRPYSAVVAFLQGVEHDGFLADLPAVEGGREAAAAIDAFLAKYGMRCVGEIDITRPRWRERPTTLLPVLLGNIKNFAPGAGDARFERGKQEAAQKERELLARLSGEQAAQTKQMIDRLRAFAGYREYPKYGKICRYFIYKQAMLREADRLVEAGVLRHREDSFFLTFHELHEAVRTQQVDDALVRTRKDLFRTFEALTPPRVLTSEGETITGSYRRDDVPDGALAGLAVSGGTIEGRARVILDLAQAEVEPGDILVTTFTDPSWTPLFVAIEGLVTEVGGLMTHGAVIAREYGLPAVVGVQRATQLIRDGQRIRVHGTAGYVEILDGSATASRRPR